MISVRLDYIHRGHVARLVRSLRIPSTSPSLDRTVFKASVSVICFSFSYPPDPSGTATVPVHYTHLFLLSSLW
jgi:hypothetical protein